MTQCHSRDWPVDLLHTDELQLFHDVWDAGAPGQVNSRIIKKVRETHFVPGAESSLRQGDN